MLLCSKLSIFQLPKVVLAFINNALQHLTQDDFLTPTFSLPGHSAPAKLPSQNSFPGYSFFPKCSSPYIHSSSNSCSNVTFSLKHSLNIEFKFEFKFVIPPTAKVSDPFSLLYFSHSLYPFLKHIIYYVLCLLSVSPSENVISKRANFFFILLTDVSPAPRKVLGI